LSSASLHSYRAAVDWQFLSNITGHDARHQVTHPARQVNVEQLTTLHQRCRIHLHQTFVGRLTSNLYA
jgi:hypothetical protein